MPHPSFTVGAYGVRLTFSDYREAGLACLMEPWS